LVLYSPGENRTRSTASHLGRPSHMVSAPTLVLGGLPTDLNSSSSHIVVLSHRCHWPIPIVEAGITTVTLYADIVVLALVDVDSCPSRQDKKKVVGHCMCSRSSQVEIAGTMSRTCRSTIFRRNSLSQLNIAAHESLIWEYGAANGQPGS